MSSLVRYLAGAALFPAAAMTRLLKDPRRIRWASAAMAFAGLLYLLTSLALAAAGAAPLTSTFLGVNPDNYYVWQMIFLLPAIAAAWIAAAGIIRLLGRTGAEGGGRERAAVCAALALSASLLIAWIPAAVEALFMVLGMGQEELVGILSPPGFWQTVYIGIHILAGLSAFGLMTAAAAVSQKIGWRKAVLAGFAAALVPAALFIYLIR